MNNHTSIARPRAAVVVFPGSNGARDMLEAFTAAGFSASFMSSSEKVASGVRAVGLPGGFSYGDYWRAGMLASQSQAVLDLERYCATGGLVIGVCNGFQILVEAGYFPGAIMHNDPPGFRHSWVQLQLTSAAKNSPWFAEVPPDHRWRMPRAHGEGNIYHPGGAEALSAVMPLRYRHNPNGSMANAASMLAQNGCMLGVMPHPERACDADLGCDDGLALFSSAYAYCATKTERASTSKATTP